MKDSYSVACASFLHVTNGHRCGSSDLCGASGCARKGVWATFPVKRLRGSLLRAVGNLKTPFASSIWSAIPAR